MGAEERVEATRRVLVLLSQADAVADESPGVCDAYMRSILPNFPGLPNFVVTDAAGNCYCSGIPLKHTINYADRFWYRRAVETRQFVAGEFVFGRITGVSGLAFAYPVVDARGALRGVVATIMELGVIHRALEAIELPPGSTVAVFDSSGTLVSGRLDDEIPVGTVVPSDLFDKFVGAAKEGGVVEAISADGAARILAIKALSIASGDFYVSVGVSQTTAFGLASLRDTPTKEIAALAAILAAAFLLAWGYSGFVVMRPVRTLQRAARGLVQGHLSVRSELSGGPAELREVSRALDDLGAALERRETERREAACELAQYQVRLRSLIDLSPDWYWEQDEQFRFTTFLAGRELSSFFPSGALIGKTRWDTPALNMTEADWDRHRAELRAHRSFKGLEIQRAGGAGPVWISTRGEPVFDEGGKFTGYRGIGKLITEDKLNEERLRESEGRFRTLADGAAVLVWISGTDKLCTYFNKSWLDFTGRTMEEELGNRWTEGVHPDDLQRCLDNYTRSFDARCDFEMDYRLRQKDGVYCWIRNRGKPLFSPGGAFLGYIGSCVEVTDRKRAEEERQRLEREILQIGESQQRRIGRELHDELGQRLTSIALMAKVLEHKLRDSGGDPGEVKRIVEAVNQATAFTRALSRGLNPVDLGENGLMAALEQMAATVSSQLGVKCEFRCNDPVLIQDNAVAVHLYRITQEAVNNALKHSRAKRIQIALKDSPRGVALSVSDNGAGFDVGGDDAKRGLGLNIMRYRADAIGGKIQIRPRIPSGTVVSVTLANASRKKVA